MPEPAEPNCVYRLLDNSVHEFVLMRGSRATIDEFIAQIEQVVQTTPADVKRLILIDNSRALQPLNYALWRLRQLALVFPQQKGSRVAVILYSTMTVTIMQGMLYAYPQINARFFRRGERDDALAWLLAEQTP